METFLLCFFSKDELSKIVCQEFSKLFRDFEFKAPKETSALMDRNEALKFLKIAKSTLNNWMRDGKIRYRKKGKRIFFIKEELLEDLEQHNIRRVG